MNSEPVIKLENISRRYGTKLALDHVSLEVPRGVVLGLVGANGAGKTTLIKHVLGLLRAKEGTARVFGLDPVTHPVEVLSRIGYLSEDRDLPPWMSIRWGHSLPARPATSWWRRVPRSPIRQP